jgi:hypothetical protein
MRFIDMSSEEQLKLHNEILALANSVGGKNFFLSLLEDIKGTRPRPLLNSSNKFNYSNGTMIWNKTIFKDKLMLLLDYIKVEDRNGSMLSGIDPKEYKKVMNMIRTLSPITIEVKPTNSEDGDGFSFPIMDTSVPKDTKVSLIFKILFLYNVEYTKKILNYEVRD